MERLSSSISPSRGLHFTIVDSIPGSQHDAQCALYILHRFPVDVFVDPYELEQRVQDKISPQFKVWGLTDLELPVSSVKDTEEGSLLILGPLDTTSNVEVSLPIHARYPLPSQGASHANVTLQDPSLLTVCTGHRKYKGDRTIYDSLFSPYEPPFDIKTTNIRSQAFTSDGGLLIQVPTGNQADLAFVEPLTIIVVVLAAFYMGRAFWKASLRFQQKELKIKQN